MKNLKIGYILAFAIVISLSAIQCSNSTSDDKNAYSIIFLHHSTGYVIWKGDTKTVEVQGILIGEDNEVPKGFKEYNNTNGTSYQISEQYFPKMEPYGWQNYPYDYYNIWVKNAGDNPYLNEPTLEMLTKKYKMIIFKHCYPVSALVSDSLNVDINSSKKTLENYKLQYTELKNKLLQFPDTKFIVWTGAVMVKAHLSEANAKLAKSFNEWLLTTWDTENDNIYLWDFYELETEGELYLKPEYAMSSDNSHPNEVFAQNVAPLFCQRIVDVIENNGTKTSLTGIYK